jgi:hypothetical protein
MEGSLKVLAPSKPKSIWSHYWEALSGYVGLGPGHLLMYLTGRFQLARSLAVAYHQRRSQRRSLSQEHCSRLEDVNIDRAIGALKREGVFSGLRLREDTLHELRSHCERSVCFGNSKRTYPFLMADRAAAEQAYQVRFSIGRYFNSLDTCSTLQNLVNDSTLISIARGYLGAEPALLGTRMWWSFPTQSNSHQQARDGQAFHYDLDDYRAISFFFYLSDVGLGSGPHVCIARSHRRKPLRFLISPFKSKSDEQIRSVYGPHQIVTLCGRAGSGFVEDLFCFHKGSHPHTTDRLLLQVRYGLKDYKVGKE